ncbi:MAG: DUF4369 domain-containing protein [Muribaculaceae bacterium]|nr:DUF4369 domain-containing protein [Muribaculaceae bacterium]
MKHKVKILVKTITLIAIIAGALTSCSNHKFRIKGEIYGAEDTSLVLEKSDFQGQWLPIDSVRINRNGGFSISFPAPPSPEIYRLALDDRYIYIPVDSTETITVNTSLEKFGREFTLLGSHNAEQMEKFEKDLHAAISKPSDSIPAFKREVYSRYMKDAPGSIVSFYILTKIVDGKPLYNPTDPEDRKYFGAVATGFKSVRPDDPHTTLLEQTVINALKKRNNENGSFRTIEAEELTLIDMNLQNEKGEYVALSDVAGKGKPVVVIFSLLNQPESPELNIALASIYNSHKGNVEFYNVSLDADQYAWRDAAKNLPWITVYSPGEGNSVDARNYNVYSLPAYFIYDAKGELILRPLSLDELSNSL